MDDSSDSCNDDNQIRITIEVNKNNQKEIVLIIRTSIKISELFRTCCEKAPGIVNNYYDYEFTFENKTLLPHETLDFYDIKNDSRLILLLTQKDYRYSDFEIDSHNRIFFNDDTPYQNENMKLKEGLNIICQCQNSNCKIQKIKSPTINNINKGLFIFQTKSPKFDFISDKKKFKLKCPKCESFSDIKACVLYNKGCIFKGIKVNESKDIYKEIEIPEYSSSLHSAKFIDIFNTDNNNNNNYDSHLMWSKLIVELKDIEVCESFQEYLMSVYPFLMKEIAFMFRNFPLKDVNACETWTKIEDDNNNIFLLSVSDNDERGICKFRDKYTTFIGYLESGEMNKSGILLDKRDNIVYRGRFKNGIKHGRGKMRLQHNIFYEGEFKEGIAHGKGVLIYPNGNTWEGPFKNGCRDGIGVYTKKKSGKKILSYYRNDRLEWNFTEELENKMVWNARKPFKKELNQNIED